MSNASSKATGAPPKDAPPIIATPLKDDVDPIRSAVTWRPWLGILFVLVLFFGSQIVGSLIVSVYPLIRGWSSAVSNDWLTNSAYGQFAYIAVVEAITFYGIYWFLRWNKATLRNIGLIKPRLKDVGFGLLATPVYFILYIVSVDLATYFFPSLNVNQHQQIGFTNVHGPGQLIVTFISLAILPPLVEEVMVRGLLYSSFKKWLPTILAVLLTSGLFAAAHLPEGGASGPLYIAAIDTFVLSLVLIFLREKTGGLWSSITLHFIKNSIAFLALFVFIST